MDTRYLFTFKASTVRLNSADTSDDEWIYPAPAVNHRGRYVNLCYGCNQPLTRVAAPLKFKSFLFRGYIYRLNVHICERCDMLIYVPLSIHKAEGGIVPTSVLTEEQHELYLNGR